MKRMVDNKKVEELEANSVEITNQLNSIYPKNEDFNVELEDSVIVITWSKIKIFPVEFVISFTMSDNFRSVTIAYDPANDQFVYTTGATYVSSFSMSYEDTDDLAYITLEPTSTPSDPEFHLISYMFSNSGYSHEQ